MKQRAVQYHGFTIVELIIVIVVIGILATITIFSYNAVVDRASITTMENDLRNAKSKLDIYKSNNGAYPADATVVDNNKGLPASSGITLEYNYTAMSDDFCVTASSVNNNVSQYHITSDSSEVLENAC